jgi:hypothetical protein
MSATTPMPQHSKSFCAAFFKKRPLSKGERRKEQGCGDSKADNINDPANQ